jgi:hypothetical protein
MGHPKTIKYYQLISILLIIFVSIEKSYGEVSIIRLTGSDTTLKKTSTINVCTLKKPSTTATTKVKQRIVKSFPFRYVNEYDVCDEYSPNLPSLNGTASLTYFTNPSFNCPFKSIIQNLDDQRVAMALISSNSGQIVITNS